jgi:hypothetical protein
MRNVTKRPNEEGPRLRFGRSRLHQVLEDGGEATELDQVQFGELGDALLTEFGQMQSHDPGVAGVADTEDEACAFDAINEPDHAVVAGVEVARGLADRGPSGWSWPFTAPSSPTLTDATCCVCQRKGCDSDAGNRVTHLSR